MVADNLYAIHRDVHRAHDRAGAIRFAGGFRAFDGEHTEQVCNSQHRAIRTGIFAPGTFHKDREQKRNTKNGDGAPGYFRAPEVEQGKVWIVGFEDQGPACGCDIQHPGQNSITGIAENIIEFARGQNGCIAA